MKSLAFAKPWLGEEEAAAAREAILSGWVTQGPRVAAFEAAFCSQTGTPHACAVSSGTTALHLALLAAGVRPGDVVVTVSHSFIATANAVRHCQAEPWFVDINPATLNMNPSALRRSLETDFATRDGRLWFRSDGVSRLAAQPESPLSYVRPPLGRLAAILVVHQVGLPADLAEILGIARKHGLPVVEDAACALGSEVSLDRGATFEPVGRPHGFAACFSFHPRKVLTTGDGGMITTADTDADARFRLLRQHGMSLNDLERHSATIIRFEQYLTTGFNYRLTDIQAAVGAHQLTRLAELVRRRRELADAYAELLANTPGVRPPQEPSYARANWQSYVVSLDPGIDRDRVMQRLMDAGIPSRRGIMNAHREPPYAAAWPAGSLPASEAAHAHGLILPLHHEMDAANCQTVTEALKEALS